MEVASSIAFVSSATSFESWATPSASAAMVALPSSTAALRPSISSLSLLRVISLLPISLSQKPSCCASWLASSMRRVIMESIIFLTLAKGSATIFWAKRPKRWLWRRLASEARNSRMRRWMPSARLAWPSPNCTSAVAPDLAWARLRYFSALPATSGDERTSMALPIAWISSSRSFCFSRNESLFSVHSVVVAPRVFSFSALTAFVAPSCFLSRAAFSALRCLSAVFSPISFAAFSTESVRSMTTMS
mmetsp:Transcript_14075/g.43923  ORF Transcript_14075/g.43923 Transcript_14075/m.43923 type:complete len:247 (-) Transcript_14075:832-1572(-)